MVSHDIHCGAASQINQSVQEQFLKLLFYDFLSFDIA